MWTHREKSDNFVQHDLLIVNLIHCSMACARISAERSIKSKQKDCWSESSRTIHIVAKFVFWWPSFACSVYLATVVPWWNEGQGNSKNTFAEMKNIVSFISKTQHTTAINQQRSNESNNFMFRLWLHPFPRVSKAGVPLNPPKKACLMLYWPHTKATDGNAKQQQKKNNNNTHTFLTVGSALKGSLAP